MDNSQTYICVRWGVGVVPSSFTVYPALVSTSLSATPCTCTCGRLLTTTEDDVKFEWMTSISHDRAHSARQQAYVGDTCNKKNGMRN